MPESLSNSLLLEAEAYSWMEWVAVVLGVVYVVLAIQQSIWCWPAGIISSLLFVWVMGSAGYYFDMMLQAYYVPAGIVSWILWRKQNNKPERKVQQLHYSKHLLFVLGGALLALGLGYLMGLFFEVNEFVYYDAATTVFAVMATIMIGYKLLENWLYWIVIDLFSVWLYWEKGYVLTALLFAFYGIIAVYGYFRWRKTMLPN